MNRMPLIKTMILAASSVALLAVSASGASADTRWQRHHPRREEVNNRLRRQDVRINRERREGELTAGQARALHQDDRQIRHEERLMATQDNGHITKTDQKALNQQENQVSHDIGK